MSSRGNVDLNLLEYFDALYVERHVSRAAERVGLSQPAMSLALKRLREVFEDPLFVPTSGGMVPTPRADELVEPARNLLRQSRELLELPRPLDPAEVVGPLQIVAADYVASLVMPNLIRRLESVAPRAQVVVRAPNVHQLRRWFEEGQVGLGIGYAQAPPDELHSRTILMDRVVAIARKDHPSIRQVLTLEQLLATPYIEVQSMRRPRHAIELEESLASQGRQLKPMLTVSDPGTALDIVEVTDMLVIVPERLALRYLERGRVQALSLPVPLPELSLAMFWHPRSHQDPLYKWLRKELVDACAGL